MPGHPHINLKTNGLSEKTSFFHVSPLYPNFLTNKDFQETSFSRVTPVSRVWAFPRELTPPVPRNGRGGGAENPVSGGALPRALLLLGEQ